MPGFPIARYLVPPVGSDAPAEYTRVEVGIAALPQRIALDDEIALVLVVPTGLARTWEDAPSDALVSTSAARYAPPSPDEPDSTVLRLHVLVADVLVGSAPLVAGLRQRLPEGTPKVELVVLRWAVYAAAMRGSSAIVSSIELAWHRCDRAVDSFSTPPLKPELVPRLQPEQRVESQPPSPGTRPATALPSFRRIREVLR